MKILLWIFIATYALACVCQTPVRYLRQDVRVDYILWREQTPTTFHGICASLLGPDKGTLWLVSHPYGHKKNAQGAIGSEGAEEKTFKTRDAAIAYAETVCPTH